MYRGERFKGDLIAAVLEAHGLRVEVFGDHAYGIGVNLTDAQVMVPDEQAGDARQLLLQAEKELDEQPSEPEEG